MSKLRLLPPGLALLSALVWGCLSLASYPIIVIADSDLGAGGMQ